MNCKTVSDRCWRCSSSPVPIFAQTPARLQPPTGWPSPSGFSMAIASALCGLAQAKSRRPPAPKPWRGIPAPPAAIRFALILGLVLIESLALYTLADHFCQGRLTGRRNGGTVVTWSAVQPGPPFRNETARYFPSHRHSVRSRRRSLQSQSPTQHREVEPDRPLRLRRLRLHRRKRHLTTEEKIQLWEWVAEYAAPDKLLIAGTGMESVRETVALTNRAAEIGYKAAMVRTPHYYKNLLNNRRRADALFPRRGRSGPKSRS